MLSTQKAFPLKEGCVARGGVGTAIGGLQTPALVCALLFQLRFFFTGNFLKLLFLLELALQLQRAFPHSLVVCSWIEKNSFRIFEWTGNHPAATGSAREVQGLGRSHRISGSSRHGCV